MPVGEKLAAERRRQGRSLPDVERATKIMGRLLDALEHDRWEDLPPAAYVKGYIQNYAQFLGLDPAPLLEEFAHDIGRPAHAPSIDRIPARAIVPHRREVHQLPRRLWAVIVVGLLAVAIVIWAISSFAGRDEAPPPVPAVTTPSVDATATPGVVPTAGPLGEPPAPEASAGSFEVVVTVEPGESSWLRVTVDGSVAFEGTLAGGEPKRFEVTDRATVRIGKPGAVTVTKDGAPVTIPMGGGIAEVTLTADE